MLSVCIRGRTCRRRCRQCAQKRLQAAFATVNAPQMPIFTRSHNMPLRPVVRHWRQRRLRLRLRPPRRMNVSPLYDTRCNVVLTLNRIAANCGALFAREPIYAVDRWLRSCCSRWNRKFSAFRFATSPGQHRRPLVQPRLPRHEAMIM